MLIMKKAKYLYFPVLLLLLPIVFCSGCTASADEQQLKPIAVEVQKSVQATLDNLDIDTLAAVSKLSVSGLSGSETRQTLAALQSKYGFIVDINTADTGGKMVTVVPSAYSRFEGTDTGKNNPTVTYNLARKPMLSGMFKAVEGMDSVVLVIPIPSQKGDIIGSVSVLFEPRNLIAPAAEKWVKDGKIEILAIQTDGLSVYDSDTSQIGKNVFKDPMYQSYKSLLDFGAKVVAGDSGFGGYNFTLQGTTRAVNKAAYWTTIGLHGTNWRLVVIKEASAAN
jgi:hypothetical protein